MKEYCLLPHSSGITWFVFLYNPRLPTWPGVAILTVDYTYQSTIKPENAHMLANKPYDGGTCLTETPSD